MRLKPPPRKLLQIVRTRNQHLTRKYIPPKILRHLQRNLVLKIAGVNRSSPRPGMPLNDEVMMNPRNVVAAHRIPHHRRNLRAKRALQILKLDDRDLLTTRRLECRGIFERCSASRRHRSLRTRRNNRSQSHNQNQTIHCATHSSGHLPTLALIPAGYPIHPVPSHASAIARKRDPLRLRARLQPFHKSMEQVGALAPGVCSSAHADSVYLKAHTNFQSTINLLTPTIKLTQTPTVRRKPDWAI